MASPPKLRSLSPETAPDLESLIQLLSEYLSDAGLAFDALMRPNTTMQIEQGVTFTTSSTSTLSGVRFKNRLPSSPRVVQLGQLRPVSSSASTALNVGNPIWQMTQGGLIQIDHIGGLAASTQYRATFVVLP